MKKLVMFIGFACLIIGNIVESNGLGLFGGFVLVALLFYEYGQNSRR